MALRKDYTSPCEKEINNMKKVLLDLRDDVNNKLKQCEIKGSEYQKDYEDQLKKILHKLDKSIDECDYRIGRLQ